MTNEEVISQLENIKDHCESMVDEDDPDDIWRRDKIALSIAIKAVKKVEMVKRAYSSPAK